MQIGHGSDTGIGKIPQGSAIEHQNGYQSPLVDITRPLVSFIQLVLSRFATSTAAVIFDSDLVLLKGVEG